MNLRKLILRVLEKAIGTMLGVYPFINTVYRSIKGYDKVNDAAREVGLEGWERIKASLKGAFVGGVKGLAQWFARFCSHYRTDCSWWCIG